MFIILSVERIYFLEEFNKANDNFSLGLHSSYNLNIDSTWSFYSMSQLSWIDSINFFQEYQALKARQDLTSGVTELQLPLVYSCYCWQQLLNINSLLELKFEVKSKMFKIMLLFNNESVAGCKLHMKST